MTPREGITVLVFAVLTWVADRIWTHKKIQKNRDEDASRRERELSAMRALRIAQLAEVAFLNVENWKRTKSGMQASSLEALTKFLDGIDNALEGGNEEKLSAQERAAWSAWATLRAGAQKVLYPNGHADDTPRAKPPRPP